MMYFSLLSSLWAPAESINEALMLCWNEFLGITLILIPSIQKHWSWTVSQKFTRTMSVSRYLDSLIISFIVLVIYQHLVRAQVSMSFCFIVDANKVYVFQIDYICRQNCSHVLTRNHSSSMSPSVSELFSNCLTSLGSTFRHGLFSVQHHEPIWFWFRYSAVDTQVEEPLHHCTWKTMFRDWFASQFCIVGTCSQ